MSAQVLLHPAAARRLRLAQTVAWLRALDRRLASTRRGNIQLIPRRPRESAH